LQVCESLVDPEDPVKLLACLRGPYFGISDTELYRFRLAGGHFSFLNPTEAKDPVSAVLQRMKGYWLLTRSKTSLTALEEICGELGLLPLAAGSENGSREAGALAGVFEILKNRPDGDIVSSSQTVTTLAEIINAGEGNGLVLNPCRRGVVRIMNLHKAKGFEAPVVFLANPTKRIEHGVNCHVDR
jgi:ATP-dependent helicase/nuclease subunit A